MKRIYVAALMFAAVSMAFTSCGGEKSKSASETSVTEDVDTVVSDNVEALPEDVADSEASEEKNSSSSGDIDELLDSYDSYVTKYISFMKKAAKGDMTAMAEYPGLMKEAEEFGEKCENAKGDFSAAQLKRYTEISAKFAKAAQEMQ